ncbi:hypothetical protein TPHA_0C03370 [Tetrapisispora phaffii CBS 4417]|uniref:Uncharacterized protein n=1 Tax=Tetrapisispora phaffii (strain ATCC 24235 / CBS 4417 / NBRC 1672 / NRRL Y-8282 / UCD 70-5) TaxID=1071381 RepID=G8BRW3_TETPH|nr:hypothetical protein TPHA_0C03370 [Tetrapisispora phaffii CBS 4417]CCE62489.1 hypothetical protein TPHA_0C03370 [Tetrapisispora phaffii CBS 4417]
MSAKLVNQITFGNDNWCLELKPLYSRGLLCSSSNGSVNLIDWNSPSIIKKFEVGETNINSLRVINNDFENGCIFAATSLASVKIYDVRNGDSPVATIKNDKNSVFLSLESRHDMLVCGTELTGVDAEMFIYDVRYFSKPVRAFVDSHHDDITDIKFHPSDKNILLSGSTDGYTNIYDLAQEDEDEALHQVINYASIHSCGWLSPKRIYTLSHMETFAIHELNDKSDELTEPRPLDFGDIRGQWDCDYVVDLYPGYVAMGKSAENAGELKICGFENEIMNTENHIIIPNAHGDEVIRDVFIPPGNLNNHSDIIYSCGEDGNVNIWHAPRCSSILNVSKDFWNATEQLDVLSDDYNMLVGRNNEQYGENSEIKKHIKPLMITKKSRNIKAKNINRNVIKTNTPQRLVLNLIRICL